MPVHHTETFTLNHPEEGIGEWYLTREQTEQLWDELGTALGYRRPVTDPVPGWSDDFVEGPHGPYDERGIPGEEAVFTEPHPGVQRVSVEEAAAQAQIAAKMAEMAAAGGHTANPHQPRGSAIGNRHTEG